MPTRTLIHEELLESTEEAVFDLLIRPSSIREWWGASSAIVLAEEGGTWAAIWGAEDDPDYVTVARISRFEPPNVLELTDYRYHSKDGPLPFEASFTTRFLVSAANGGTRLRVEQAGFPENETDFWEGCVQGWKDTFNGIRRFCSDSVASRIPR